MVTLIDVNFGEAGNSAEYMRTGWSHQEPTAVWAVGRESTIWMPAQCVSGAQILSIDCIPYLSEYRPAQRVVLFVNGLEVGRSVISQHGHNVVEARVPAGLLVDDSDGNVLRIYHPDSSIPADIDGPDIRDLAIYVSSIRLSMAEGPGERAEIGQSNAGLMGLFQSIGDNCEFGLVQRKFGAEPLGLLRFTAIGVEGLLEGLGDRFSRAGENVSVKIGVANEFMIHEDTYDFLFHTFIYEGDGEQVGMDMARRLRFLRRSFSEELSGRRKIFVYRQTEPDETGVAYRISEALAAVGENMFLFVGLCRPGFSGGQVEVVSKHLLRGYVSEFRPLHEGNNVKYAEWLAICQAAYENAVAIGYFQD